MARKLEVEIIGDASSYERAIGRASGATSGFGGTMAKVGKMAAVAGTAILGGVVFGLEKSVKAAMAAQSSQAALDTALRTTHQSVTDMAPALDAAEAASRKLGFADDESRQALARLEIATGNTKNAISDLSVAEDIARIKHVDLAGGATMLAMAMTGSQRAAKQLGITVSPVTTNLDALKASTMDLTTASGRAAEAHARLLDKMATGQAVIQAVTDKVHGQADAYASTAAGGMEQFHAQLNHLEVALGEKLLPAVTAVAEKLGEFIAYLDAHKDLTVGLVAGISALGAALLIAAGAQAVMNLAVLANPYVAAAVAIAALVTGIVILYETNARARETMNAAWADIRSVVLPIVNEIAARIRLIARTVEDVAALIGDLIHGRWSQIWDDFKSVVADALKGAAAQLVPVTFINKAVAIGEGVVSGIKSGLGDLLGMIHKKLSEVGAAIRGWVGSAYAYAFSIGSAIAEGVVSGIGDLAGKVISKVGGAIKSGLGFLHHHIGSTLEEYAAYEIGAPMVAGIVQGIEDSTPGLAFTLKNSILAAGQGASATAIEAGTTLGGMLVGGLVDGVQRLQGMVNDMMAAVVDAALASSLAEVVRAAQRSVGAISGVGASHPSVGIMGLQSGGIVTRPTLALVGEHGPEAVVPLGAGGGFGGDTYVFQFPNYLGSKDDLINTIKGGFAKKKFRGGL